MTTTQERNARLKILTVKAKDLKKKKHSVGAIHQILTEYMIKTWYLGSTGIRDYLKVIDTVLDL